MEATREYNVLEGVEIAGVQYQPGDLVTLSVSEAEKLVQEGKLEDLGEHEDVPEPVKETEEELADDLPDEEDLDIEPEQDDI